MPITGRNLQDVTSTFRDYLNSVLAATVTVKPLTFFIEGQQSFLGFRDHGRRSVALLQTAYGPMQLRLSHVCDAIESERRNHVDLRTVNYGYTIQPVSMHDALIRWEYVRFPGEGATYCQHHVQGAVTLMFANERGEQQHIILNDWHLPTGWVAIEEVLRFCINDLHVRPLSDDWDQLLRDSLLQFRTQFAHPGEA